LISFSVNHVESVFSSLCFSISSSIFCSNHESIVLVSSSHESISHVFGKLSIQVKFSFTIPVSMTPSCLLNIEHQVRNKTKDKAEIIQIFLLVELIILKFILEYKILSVV
jgi:hypothetical protein